VSCSRRRAACRRGASLRDGRGALLLRHRWRQGAHCQPDGSHHTLVVTLPAFSASHADAQQANVAAGVEDGRGREHRCRLLLQEDYRRQCVHV